MTEIMRDYYRDESAIDDSVQIMESSLHSTAAYRSP